MDQFKYYLMAVLCFCVVVSQAQNVQRVEYFFDTPDPGTGLANRLPFSNVGNTVGQSFSISTAGLSEGFHSLTTRVQQEDGTWSSNQSSRFFVFTPVVRNGDLMAAEYFFDQDPGLGNAINLNIPLASTVNQSFAIPTDGLAEGFHTLTMRVQNQDGVWSNQQSSRFFVFTPVIRNGDIAAAEYFLDTDPGLGNGTAFTASGNLTSQSVTVDVSELEDGFHTLTVRTQNEDGVWSTNRSERFFLFVPIDRDDLVALEYFIDDDPGVGLANPIEIDTTNVLDSTLVIDLPDLTEGSHTLAVRAQNNAGEWSFAMTSSFEAENRPFVTDFSPSEGGPGTLVTINGRNFDPSLTGNVVRFGSVVGTVQSVQGDTLLVAQVPVDASGIVSVSVEVAGASGFAEDFFNVNVLVPDGLIAFYPFNGNAEDESQFDNDGTVEGATLTLDRFGNFSSAYLFDGVDDRVFAAEVTPFQNSFLVWINSNTLPNQQFDPSLIEIGNDGDGRYFMSISSTLIPSFGIETTAGDMSVISPDPILSNIWTLLAATYDGQFLRFFVDGTLVAEEEVGFININLSGINSLSIGDDGVGSNPPFSGVLDDIRIYDRALTIEEIQTIAADRAPSPPVIGNQSFSVNENTIAGASVGTLEASDVNNDVLTFSIISGNVGNAFSLIDSTGVLLVNNTEALDFEVTPSIDLTVEVSDGAESAQAIATITIQDVDESVNQAPQVLPASFSLEENRINGTPVGSLTTFDPDGDALSFSIIAGNIGSAFSIDNDGDLSVSNGEILNFEQIQAFSLTIRVSDGAFNTDVIVEVAILDVDEGQNQSPQIVNTRLMISENSTAGSLIGNILAADPDGDDLTFTILSGDPSNAFEVSNTGNLTVSGNQPLDFESIPEFLLTIQVSDGEAVAIGELILEILDVNEAPIVEAQVFSILENSPSNSAAGTIVASDPDGNDLAFALMATNNEEAFTIGPGGELLVLDSALLDFESNTQFAFTVEVSDGLLATSAAITLNVLNVNEAPQAEDEVFTLLENSAAGTVVGTVQGIDPENDVLTYSIASGNEEIAFQISASSGEITVSNPAPLDFESSTLFTLLVSVSDGELSREVTATINLTNVNEAPIAGSQDFNLAENSSAGTSVGSIVASDPENDDLSYTILSGNVDNVFIIDEETGTITVNASEPLDFEATESFALEISVSDGNLSSVAMATINLADVNESPEAEDQVFSLAENSAMGAAVGFVVATDQESDLLTYSITSGNLGSTFLINSSTGELLVNEPTLLDFEVNPSFALTLSITDGELETSIQVDVQLTDINESPEISGITDQELFIGGMLEIQFTISDVDGDELTLTATSENQQVLNGNSLSFSGSGESRTLTIDASNAQIGQTTIVITVSDEELDGSTSFQLNIGNVTSTAAVNFEEALKLYPNPASSRVNIHSTLFLENEVLEIKVFDIAGNEYYPTLTRINQLDYELFLGEMASGVYLIHLQVNDQSFVRKIIKNN